HQPGDLAPTAAEVVDLLRRRVVDAGEQLQRRTKPMVAVSVILVRIPGDSAPALLRCGHHTSLALFFPVVEPVFDQKENKAATEHEKREADRIERSLLGISGEDEPQQRHDSHDSAEDPGADPVLVVHPDFHSTSPLIPARVKSNPKSCDSATV